MSLVLAGLFVVFLLMGIPVAIVIGAATMTALNLSGMPLNHQLTSTGGRLVRACRTAKDYRLFVLPGTTPAKPGMVCDPGSEGPGLSVEVWALSRDAFGAFVDAIPAPLGIGKIALEDGSSVSGFLCESHAVLGAREITHLGGWRAYMAEMQAT